MGFLEPYAFGLQVWGALFFLLHKITCSRYERASKQSGYSDLRWQVRSWIVYLIGLPAVVLFLLVRENWIFAGMEASAFPVMLVGLWLVWHRKRQEEMDYWAVQLQPLVYLSIGFGLGASCVHFGGLLSIRQWLEMISSASFLIGSHLQARNSWKQYPAYTIMNTSTAILFWREGSYLFAVQQALSLAFILDAWMVRRQPRPNWELSTR